MVLTRDNYYSAEADWEYMSCSQFQGWNECEAKQMAKLQGRWEDPPTEALIVGNYFHTYFESPEAHAQFCEEHFGDIFKSRTLKSGEVVVTGKYAAFETADRMIRVAETDELISSLLALEGENEKILTGTIFGVPWRVRYDKYVPDGRMIIDYKTCASITELKWSDEMQAKVSFVDAMGYMFRAAVYSEIEKQAVSGDKDPEFLIIAVSKQDPPDKDVLRLNHRARYDYELEKVKERLPYILRIKDGSMKPRRCGRCAYCRATKHLFAIRPYYKLMPEFSDGKEEDYADGTGEMLAGPSEAGELE